MTKYEVLTSMGAPYEIIEDPSSNSSLWIYMIHVEPLKFNKNYEFSGNKVVGKSEMNLEYISFFD
jgi:hypothetical protein